MMKYQSEMLGTWKRLREGQRERERTESSKGIKWNRVPGREVTSVELRRDFGGGIHGLKTVPIEAREASKSRLKVLDKIGSTKEVTDLSAWKDFEIDGFEFSKSDKVIWVVLVVVTLFGLVGGV